MDFALDEESKLHKEYKLRQSLVDEEYDTDAFLDAGKGLFGTKVTGNHQELACHFNCFFYVNKGVYQTQ